MTTPVLLRIQGWSEQPVEVPEGGDVLTVQHPPSGQFFSVVVNAEQLADPAKLEAAWAALVDAVHRAVGEDPTDITPPQAPTEKENETRNLGGRVKGRRELLTPERVALLTDGMLGVLVEDADGEVWRDEGRACGHYTWPGRTRPNRTKVTRQVRELERVGWLVPKHVDGGPPLYVPSMLAAEALAGSVR